MSKSRPGSTSSHALATAPPGGFHSIPSVDQRYGGGGGERAHYCSDNRRDHQSQQNSPNSYHRDHHSPHTSPKSCYPYCDCCSDRIVCNTPHHQHSDHYDSSRRYGHGHERGHEHKNSINDHPQSKYAGYIGGRGDSTYTMSSPARCYRRSSPPCLHTIQQN